LINKNVVLGLIASGIVAHIREEEIDKSTIDSVESKLYKKLYSFKNGGEDFRAKIKKISFKKRPSKKDIKILNKQAFYLSRYEKHVSIANNSWEILKENTKNDVLSLHHLVNSLMYHEEVMKFYNLKKHELLQLIGGYYENDNGKPFSSLKVANKLLRIIDLEVLKYVDND